MRNAFLRGLRKFFLTLPNGNEESALAKHPGNFFLLLSTADEKCVWEKIGTLFWKAFLTLHYRGFESRLGEKTGNFFWKIFCSYYLLEVNSRFGRKLLNFSLFTSQRTWEVRLGEKIGNFFELFLFPFSTGGEMPKWSAFRAFFLPHLHVKNVNPLSSTTHWRKSGCLNEKVDCYPKLFSLIYLDRKRLIGRKIWK